MGDGGPRIGELLPDFRLIDGSGRTIWRRDFKGRWHLIVCCAHPDAQDGGRALLSALGAAYPALRAERGEVIVVPPDAGLDAGGGWPFPVASGPTAALRAVFGATGAALLLLADRYGEIVLREEGREPAGGDLPLERLAPLLAWLEMRCSL